MTRRETVTKELGLRGAARGSGGMATEAPRLPLSIGAAGFGPSRGRGVHSQQHTQGAGVLGL
jgi:hypothetical protein